MHKLHFLSAGPPPPNPSELLLKPEFDELLKKLSMLYDVIILDTPPVGLVTDGILALKKADLPIYVLRSDFSKTHYLETLMRLNKIHKFSNLTVLLNSIKMSSQGYGYGYGEGY
jgi:Mrp family chromosome partitioning ATPase